jgi:uncharacterized damage-inducible protein DinB
MSFLRHLTAHLAWADARVHEALDAAAPGTDSPALALSAHILGAEHVWLARLTGVPPRVQVWPALSLAEARDLEREVHMALDGYVGGLVPADLEREIAYVNSAGQAFRSTIEDILLHVYLHGAYHRGQIVQLLRQGGAIPIPTDYIAFRRGAPAATRGS